MFFHTVVSVGPARWFPEKNGTKVLSALAWEKNPFSAVREVIAKAALFSERQQLFSAGSNFS